jgi:bifunctional ADP-heptose synthase (sugar kinase/adenylyltransferase)
MRSAESKIASLEEIASRVAAERAAGRKIALASGPFELLHAGSVRFLSAAKAEADVLVVAVTEDEQAAPLVPAADRALLLGALRVVDHVLVVPRAEIETVRERTSADIHRLDPEGETRALLARLRR